ncbi:unnamed protein product [Pieris macdunnoughi]|uniref:Arrestin C-terminal-like domain-containing protein n=1 Tax=Pieris macdunnoughi TaxID=345717 RepID=A0A821QZR5_9NEOP|nr:unnamed protein product [Pieris macdunnoughi]
MGIHCRINLKPPPNGVFLSGSVITGEIKYAVDEVTSLKQITLSLKGIGTLRMKKRSASRHEKSKVIYRTEEYVNIKQVLLNKDNGDGNLEIGSYTTPFKFEIPERIPPSADIFRKQGNHTLRYKVEYFISMKFEKTAFFSFTKRFRKDIKVLSDIIPTLPRDAMIFGERKNLFQPFSSTDSIVNLKSTILSSVVRAGDTIQFEYEIANNSHVTVKSVETKLIELVKSKKRRSHITFTKSIDGTDSKSGSIENGKSQQMITDIRVPEDAYTINACNLAERSYAVLITVGLPMPHMNFELTIPVEIMLKSDNVVEIAGEDAPPSYWDVMCEDKKELEMNKNDLDGE